MSDDRAIGVFDSGIGGLTVLSAVKAALPDEPTVYLGDTARVPYGTRSADVVVRYAKNNVRTMMALAELKLLVVACNTASAVALPALQKMLPFPVLGVIEPGAEAALQASRGGRVLVLGTPGTIRSGAYPRAFAARGRDHDVEGQACPLLVPLVEEGWTEGDIPEAVARRYLEGRLDGVDTVVLGCTHYPLLRPVIERIVGAGVAVVDGGVATAERVRALLDETGRRAAGAGATHRVLVTDAPEQMERLAPRFLGHALDDEVALVDVIFAGEDD